MTFKRYFFAELKRISRLFPEILGLSLLFFALTLLVGKMLIANSDYETGKTKYRIGIIAEGENSFIDMGIYLLESFDDTKYLVEIVKYDDFETASEDLSESRISALGVIPEEFYDAINEMSNDAVITYYTASGERGITAVYMDEITKMASNYIMYSQAGIFSLMDYMDENGYPSYMMYEETDRLFLSYMGVLLGRGDLVEVETLGIGNGLSTYGYFFTGLSLFFVCVLSFAGISFFLGKNRSLEKLAYAKGINPVMQVSSDFIAYYLCNAICVLIFLIPVFIFLKAGVVEIREFSNPGLYDCISYLKSIYIAMLLITIFQLITFEILDGTINKIIFSFVIVLGSAYVSGLLYPKSFFPEIVQRVGELLPTGVALSFLSDSFATGSYGISLVVLFIYFIALFSLMSFIRYKKIKQ